MVGQRNNVIGHWRTVICQATTVVGKMSRMGHRINVIGC